MRLWLHRPDINHAPIILLLSETASQFMVYQGERLIVGEWSRSYSEVRWQIASRASRSRLIDSGSGWWTWFAWLRAP